MVVSGMILMVIQNWGQPRVVYCI